ncbi:F0F1 ATP synthase subunit A [Clostridium thermobutyricum]
MDVFGELFELKIAGLSISGDIVIQWVVMGILILIAMIFTRNFSVENPSKIQIVLELIYEKVNNLVEENMDKSYSSYIPFVGTLAIYLGVLNILGIFGFAPPTRNLSVVTGFTIITFVLVHGNAIKRNGLKSYFKSYGRPFVAMLPITIMEKIVFPLSLALRLFGNVLAATIVVELVYTGLSKINWFAQLVIPIAPHGFFDLFDGTIQTIIFVMLTIITIKLQAEE